MPRSSTARRAIPWALLLRAATLLIEHGRRGYDELAPRERRDLVDLVRRSRGRRRNLTDREYAELRRIVGKGLRAVAHMT